MIRDFYLGIIKLYILSHATAAPIFGLELIRALQAHGYTLSPGTLYPLLHRLETEGYLQLRPQTVNGKVRKYYVATSKGKAAWAAARAQARDLLAETGET